MPLTRRPLSEAQCPITRAVDVLADKWTLLILKNATVGMTRFNQFSADLGIADNILSARLSRLVELGLMTRVPYRGVGRTRDEYKLTAAGAAVLPILHRFADWGHEYTTVNGAQAEPIRFIHTVCGNLWSKASTARAAMSWCRAKTRPGLGPGGIRSWHRWRTRLPTALIGWRSERMALPGQPGAGPLMRAGYYPVQLRDHAGLRADR